MRILLLLIIFLTTSSALLAQPCKECSLIDPTAICSLIWDPVCGCDGVTYSNDCVAVNGAGIISWTSGECPSNNASPCSDLSNVDFGPCEMIIGWGIVNGEATLMSGCGTTSVGGIDFSLALYTEPEFLEINCLCGSVNGLLDFDRLDVKVFPSPVVDQFQVFYSSPMSLQMSLVDITGRTIKEQYLNSGDFIDVANVQNGIYILVLSHEDQVMLSKRISIKK